jgi:hypothetical protein
MVPRTWSGNTTTGAEPGGTGTRGWIGRPNGLRYVVHVDRDAVRRHSRRVLSCQAVPVFEERVAIIP